MILKSTIYFSHFRFSLKQNNFYCSDVSRILPERNMLYQHGPLMESQYYILFTYVLRILSMFISLCKGKVRLGTVIVLVSSGIGFVNTPRLYSDRATCLKRLPIWPCGLCQREPKVPGLYKTHTANSTSYARDEARTSECLFDRQMP